MRLSTAKLIAFSLIASLLFIAGQSMLSVNVSAQVLPGACHRHNPRPAAPASDNHRCCITSHDSSFLITSPPNPQTTLDSVIIKCSDPSPAIASISRTRVINILPSGPPTNTVPLRV